MYNYLLVSPSIASDICFGTELLDHMLILCLFLKNSQSILDAIDLYTLTAILPHSYKHFYVLKKYRHASNSEVSEVVTHWGLIWSPLIMLNIFLW